MGTQRAHIELPDALIQQIDELVGPQGRSAFLAETAQAEVQRRQLLRLLESTHPIWKDEDHPELADGSASWVRELRKEADVRFDPFHPDVSRSKNNSKSHSK